MGFPMVTFPIILRPRFHQFAIFLLQNSIIKQNPETFGGLTVKRNEIVNDARPLSEFFPTDADYFY